MKVLFIIITLLFVILLLLLRNISSYTAAQANSPDRYSQPIIIGKTWDTGTNGWILGDNCINGSTADNALSWDNLNIQMWSRTFTSSGGAARTCYGFRKTLQAGGNGQVVWLLRPIVSGGTPISSIFPSNLADAGVLENVVINSVRYAVPDQVTAVKSIVNPVMAANCVYSVANGTACSATACGTSGTYTDTVTITTPKVAEGTCNYTNGAPITSSGQTFSTRSCSAAACPWAPPTYFTTLAATPPPAAAPPTCYEAGPAGRDKPCCPGLTYNDGECY